MPKCAVWHESCISILCERLLLIITILTDKLNDFTECWWNERGIMKGLFTVLVVVVVVMSTDYCFAHQYETIDLGTTHGTAFTMARDINNNGEVVGYGEGQAFYWKDGVFTNLTTTARDPNSAPTTAWAINNSGKIVGVTGSLPFVLDVRGTRGAISLDVFGINTSGSARDINDSGYIVGETIASSRSSGDARLWNPNDFYGQSHPLDYGIDA